MGKKEILMYTMTTCAYCKKMKDELDKQKLEYVERDYKEYSKEWDVIKSLTRSAVFPTFVIGKEYIIPNRDFKSPEEGVNYIKYVLSLPILDTTLEDIVELLKNSMFMLKSLGDKIYKLETQFDKVLQQQDRERIRKGIIERQKRQALELKNGPENRKNKIEEAKELQKENNINLEAYVQQRMEQQTPQVVGNEEDECPPV